MNNTTATSDMYVTTVGLEIHAELKTTTKMFCACINAPHESTPNIHVCPTCMAHPGTLPRVNRNAVSKVLEVGMALGSKLATYTEFDRKNYFYPDIPKGYQISQYAYPLLQGGELTGVRLTRIHLEEDTARSSHEHQEGSVVDYNRAGVPLMELVTEPVIHDAATAGAFAKELQLLLRELNVSDANMEKGEMRVEANISVSKNEVLGTKVEVKNLNSLKAVEAAILFETKRQIGVLGKGEGVIQETRGWDDSKSATFSQRKKEASHDYRYFPDPDILSFEVGSSFLSVISRKDEILHKVPSKIRTDYLNLGLTREQADALIGNPPIRHMFNHTCQHDTRLAKIAANYLTTDLQGLLASGQLLPLDPSPEYYDHFIELFNLLAKNFITSRVAKDILPQVVSGLSPLQIVRDSGLERTSDTELLTSLVLRVIEEHPGVVAEVKSGKISAIQFLVGQGMKLAKGAADPQTLRSLFEEALK
jgi:aspartyl-tRNA(Asn)/glutamyl-tRNA(Gln) amidotransferase subunit B